MRADVAPSRERGSKLVARGARQPHLPGRSLTGARIETWSGPRASRRRRSLPHGGADRNVLLLAPVIPGLVAPSRERGSKLDQCEIAHRALLSLLRGSADRSMQVRPSPESDEVAPPRRLCDRRLQGRSTDRLLADFAKLVELFDCNGVSFGAATRSLNTTISAGAADPQHAPTFPRCSRKVTGKRIRSLPESVWWSQAESNRRPLECHSSALPTELWPHRGAVPDVWTALGVAILKDRTVSAPFSARGGRSRLRSPRPGPARRVSQSQFARPFKRRRLFLCRR